MFAARGRGLLLLLPWVMAAALIGIGNGDRIAAAPPGQLAAGETHPGLFGIHVVDRKTGRGVPLVELTTVHGVRYVTDSAGWIAISDPELLGRRVFFYVKSHGYEYPKDGFGFRGIRLKLTPGRETRLKLRRINIAERLYRITGAGSYRDSVLLGKPVPIKHPLMNAGVAGSDSVVQAVYRGRLFWFWGDTNRLEYPLGNFHVPGATSTLPAKGGLPPSRGVDLEYFVREPGGFAKETARMPGSGPTWINGLTVLKDGQGRDRLLAGYVKVKPPLKIYARGIVEFDEQSECFEKRADIAIDAPLYPHGHPILYHEGKRDYVYFASPYPLVRVAASVEAFLDPRRYEAYTYYRQGSTPDNAELDRSSDGRLRLAWKRNTLPPSLKRERQLIRSGQLRESERIFAVRDIESGRAVRLHSGSVAWNAYRKRWIMIAVSSFDRSPLGEIWFSESRSLEGPWKRARRIVTHDRYSFYNPKHHAVFDEQGGRVIYFEGTYTKTFSGNEDATPRYDYNQIMYRLDLGDSRLDQALFESE